MKKVLPAIAATLFAVCLLVYNRASVEAAAAAVELWLCVLLPSLLPFMVAMNLIKNVGGTALRPWQIVILGSMAGAPAGAGLCDENSDIPYLIPLANQTSPMFIVGALGTGMLGSTLAGVLILTAQIASTVVCCILFGRGLFQQAKPHKSATTVHHGLVGAVDSAVSAMLKVLGAVILFASLSGLLRHTLAEVLPACISTALAGVLEMATGCSAAASSLNTRTAITACSFFTAFGGLSVFMQVNSLIRTPPWRYLTVKLTEGVLAAVITYFLSGIALLAEPTFLASFTNNAPRYEWLAILGAAALSTAAGALLAIPRKNKSAAKRRRCIDYSSSSSS